MPSVKIALDAVGGDAGLSATIEGAIAAANAFGVEVLLVGPRAAVRSELSARGIAETDSRFSIEDASEAVGMDEDAASACRAKPRSSIMLAAQACAQGRTSAFVSAGNSAATRTAALWHLKRIPGVLRPAIAVPIPTPRGVCILLDAEANMDCKPWHLVQFAMMGSLFCRLAYGVASPKVGLLSSGEEEGSGNDLAKQAFSLLKNAEVNFSGCVEGRDVPMGKVDVVVCDGFVGNVIVKSIEGTASAMMSQLKGELRASWRYRLPALALRGPLSRLNRKMSYDEYGGAPLLGIDGTVIVAHGCANARAITNAIGAAVVTARACLPKGLREVVTRAAQATASTHPVELKEDPV
ncbi:MAG: phosphate acyltransferase PlsX [Elusimicrobiota bacterium]